MQKRLLKTIVPTATVFALAGATWLHNVTPATAEVANHSTANCKRFFLKRNKDTGRWECLYKVKKKVVTKKNKSLNKRIASLESLINQSKSISRDLTQRQIRLTTDQLQRQKRFMEQLKAAQDQLANELRRQQSDIRDRQIALTTDLLAKQKARMSALIQQGKTLYNQQKSLGR